MKVLMVNGSANERGCTFTVLSEIGNTLRECGVEYEIFQLGAEAVRDCSGCRGCRKTGKCVFEDNHVNEFIELAQDADGFVFGSPVYYAHPSGRLLSFLDRAFYASSGEGSPFFGKPGAAVVSARRGGTTASLDAINKYFGISSMPTVPSTYWNMAHGQSPEEVMQDAEGLQTMRNVGRNLAWLIKLMKAGQENGIQPPVLERMNKTNFIR